MENLEKESINEVIYSLHEWGLNTLSKHHVKFRQRAVRDCVACIDNFRCTEQYEQDFGALKGQKFPRSYKDAYEYVLRHDEYDGDIFECTDKLELHDIYPEPYYRLRDYQTGKVYDYKKKDAFKMYTPEQLDPLRRWKFDLISYEEHLFKRWFVDDDHASKLGTLMEALVACHALASEACYNCKFRKTLRWNGGGSGSWQDMLCIECGATYEVKTKKDLEAVEKTLLRNALQGGSFSAWCQLKASKQQASIPTYLVLLPRQFTQNRKLESIHPVIIAEICKVIPKAYEGTFNPNYETIHFKSTISLKLSSKTKWFDLPYTDEFTGVVLDSIAEKVYKELFSEELFECFSSTYFDSDRAYTEKDTDESGLSLSNNDEINDVESVTTKFQDIRVVPDDWEDLASDSD